MSIILCTANFDKSCIDFKTLRKQTHDMEKEMNETSSL